MKPLDSIRASLTSKVPLTWLFAGDSITQGAVHTRGWRDYTQLFRERLVELGRNEDVVINTAAAGWTLATFVPRFADRVTHYRPQILLCMFGTNDAAAGENGTAEFCGLYKAVLNECKEREIQMVVQTTVPTFPVDLERYATLTYANPELREEKSRRLKSRSQFLINYVVATRNLRLKTHWC